MFDALVSLLGTEDPELRLQATRLLIEQGRADEQAFEALVSVLGIEDPFVLYDLEQFVIEVGRGDERVFDALVSVLGTEDESLAKSALLRLSSGDPLEPKDGEMLAALVSVREQDDDRRRNVRSILAEFIAHVTGAAARTVDIEV